MTLRSRDEFSSREVGLRESGDPEPLDDPTRAIATYVVRLQLADLPEAAVERSKVAILDTIGVSLAGSQLETARIVTRYVRGTGASGVATVLASSMSTSPELAALANGVLAHVLDFDDRGHASTHTLPAALALGEQEGITGRDLLLAYVVGREVRQHIDEEFRPGRKSQAGVGSGPGWRGWHETGVVGTLGAAAASAKVLQLDIDRTIMALGIAASLASGLMVNFGTSTKSLHAGNAARNGVLAATLAANGFTADPNALTARRGLVEALSYPETRDLSKVARGLASYFHLVEKGVRIKPYPSCTGTHTYIETMRVLRAKHDIRPDEVESLTIGRLAGQTTKRDYPTTELECKFSPAFVAVATIIDGQLDLANCSQAFLFRKDVQDLLSRTDYEDSEAGFLRVTTRSGDRYEEALAPIRDLVSPSEIVDKFHACADPVIGRSRAVQVRDAVEHLEGLARVSDLTGLIAES